MKTKLFTFVFALFAAFIFMGMSSASLEDKTNGEWVTISGTVTSVAADHFYLKTDNDKIFVEVDDYDWDADGYKLVKGDNVVVRGKVDQDFLEKKKIEAGSVYVKSLDTYFYASAADEEGPVTYNATLFSMKAIPLGSFADAFGTVEKVEGRDFIVDVGWRDVRVDTKAMTFNPTDDTGLVQVDKGDIVRVSGLVTNEYWDGKEILAKYLVVYN